MKRLLILLLTLALLLSSAAAETANIPLMNVKPDYTGTVIALGSTGLTLTLPNGWAVVAAPDGAAAAFSSPDMALTVAITADYDLSAIRTQNAEVEGAAVSEAYVNGVYYLFALSADKTQKAAYTLLSNGSVIALTFVFATAEMGESSVLPEKIISTLAGTVQ